MTEAHPVRKLLNDLEAELSALDPVTDEMAIAWRNSLAGRKFFLQTRSEIAELLLERSNDHDINIFTNGALSILDDVVTWGIPEEVEDGDIQG